MSLARLSLERFLKHSHPFAERLITRSDDGDFGRTRRRVYFFSQWADHSLTDFKVACRQIPKNRSPDAATLCRRVRGVAEDR